MQGKKTIPDDTLSDVLNRLYNEWFRTYRKKIGSMTDDDWNKMVDDIEPVWKLGEQYPIVNHLVLSFLYELDARMHGGYTETTKDKLMRVIKCE